MCFSFLNRFGTDYYWDWAEPIVESPQEKSSPRESAWYNVTGMALAGCPSAKDVAKIASQKSIDKGIKTPSESEEEEESSSEEDEDDDPDAIAEKRALREVKLLHTKITNFK